MYFGGYGGFGCLDTDTDDFVSTLDANLTLAGEVVYAGWGGMVGSDAGLNIIIDHKNGYYSVYAHLADTYVSTGDYVDRKQTIGAMGRSGTVTGTHLHLTMQWVDFHIMVDNL